MSEQTGKECYKCKSAGAPGRLIFFEPETDPQTGQQINRDGKPQWKLFDDEEHLKVHEHKQKDPSQQQGQKKPFMQSSGSKAFDYRDIVVFPLSKTRELNTMLNSNQGFYLMINPGVPYIVQATNTETGKLEPHILIAKRFPFYDPSRIQQQQSNPQQQTQQTQGVQQ